MRKFEVYTMDFSTTISANSPSEAIEVFWLETNCDKSEINIKEYGGLKNEIN
jgi:hypothetical protein